MTENSIFTTKKGNSIQLSLYGTHLSSTAPCIVYLHGFKGFKDWGFAPATGKLFESHGFRFLALNFSHNGIGDDPMAFTETDKFRANTLSLELEEAMEVVNACYDGQLFGMPAGARMGLLGHSRGGGLALLAGSQLPNIEAVCTWAAVSTYRRYPEEVIQKWEKEGVLEVKNARTGQVMELGWELHADLMRNINGSLNIEMATKNLGKPLCVIHGTADAAVVLEDGENIAKWADSEKVAFHIIEGAGHTFGSRHPFVAEGHQMEEVWGHTLDFFTQNLKN